MNALTGTIPSSLFTLTAMEHLILVSVHPVCPHSPLCPAHTALAALYLIASAARLPAVQDVRCSRKLHGHLSDSVELSCTAAFDRLPASVCLPQAMCTRMQSTCYPFMCSHCMMHDLLAAARCWASQCSTNGRCS